jgi:DNA-binding MarR family transcriptional regulator
MDTSGPEPATYGDGPDRRLILAARTILILHREFERAARHAEITIPQYRFLLRLKRGASRARELASDSAIGKPTASALINEMEKRGLIVREPDARDGRSALLRLTDEGVAKHAAFERTLAGLLSDFVPIDNSDEILEGLTQLAYRIDRRPRD